ncbi:hypothetical protein ABB37_01333 [Leptomonas pyrrhocoris]|uniref:Uncharacterized protein n=1 Tax=Leptomonas pyrrhocoris TaxID=157538 RepID=A0A0M9G8D7_LEPPY|nr:hypothetical protein ABB37_01333 [Leptomonas pyrrhocoris]XP_015663310.1 hypothetical protein ABB37_01333 [Leptomonas pyrrhocoris]KPA84870.1 hypothetical protein ABB37_01333 [Leptomonas pyrrhocoris]KPA84871.1 hypothetical protein ABB37_01333 [Leptomonas pyrrhocoris]|eukprot:XP_015663309.1 hypothetical protein ABB37_01333 [Leptomonas pyrrhocoris]
MSEANPQTGYPESLTAEQKALLAQFELRAISASDDTSVIVVGHPSMRYTEGASSSSSSRTSSAHSHHAERDSAPLNATANDTVQSYLVSVTQDALPTPSSALSTSPPQDKPETKLLMTEEEQLFQGTEKGDIASGSSGEKTCDDYVVSITPLLHHGKDSTNSSRSKLSAENCEKWKALALRMTTTDVDATSNRGIDEHCQALADRLVRLSSAVDAAEFAMDHNVPPPSEFF